jgi:hypothetical protein
LRELKAKGDDKEDEDKPNYQDLNALAIEKELT